MPVRCNKAFNGACTLEAECPHWAAHKLSKLCSGTCAAEGASAVCVPVRASDVPNILSKVKPDIEAGVLGEYLVRAADKIAEGASFTTIAGELRGVLNVLESNQKYFAKCSKAQAMKFTSKKLNERT